MSKMHSSIYRFFLLFLFYFGSLSAHAVPIEKKLNLLVIGSGGREHGIAWKLSLSEHVEHVFVAPGSAAISQEKKISSIPIQATDIQGLVNFAQTENIDFTIVGPEKPLAIGIVDAFEANGLKCLGPTQKCALLETSKAFGKAFMKRHHIPHAHSEAFTDFAEASHYIKMQKFPLVIKADGLHGGKGVSIAETHEEGIALCHQILLSPTYSISDNCVIIEEFLEGEELSFIVLTDGETILPLEPVQDYKKRNDGGKGPNTGGMGAYSFSDLISPALKEQILQRIVNPTIQGICEEEGVYKGFLYFGLMLTPQEGPKVLEYNCRLGDPETEAIVMRLENDLALLCQDALTSRLKQRPLKWNPQVALSLVLVSKDYPRSSTEYYLIEGLSCKRDNGIKIFHSNTFLEGEDFYAKGGRILCVTVLGETPLIAREKAYEVADEIYWEEKDFRTDIGIQTKR